MQAGLLISQNGVWQSDDVPLEHAEFGLVYLDDEGGWAPVEEGPTPESRWAA